MKRIVIAPSIVGPRCLPCGPAKKNRQVQGLAVGVVPVPDYARRSTLSARGWKKP
jgi:hypothetical protein